MSALTGGGAAWHYMLYELPDDSKRALYTQGGQDCDIWLESNLVNVDWFTEDFASYREAMDAGIVSAHKLVEFKALPSHLRGTPALKGEFLTGRE